MIAADLLLWAALASFLAGAGLDLSRRGDPRLPPRLLGVGAALSAASLAWLLLGFLLGRLGIEYVFTYTRLDYAWYYRLAGLWAGQKGTLLLWTSATAAFGVAYQALAERALRTGRLQDAAREDLRATRIGLFCVLGLLMGAVLVSQPFAQTPAYLLQLRPDGNGLQPVLLTPFMIIHPPIQFLAYALTGLLFAAAVGHWASGGNHWAVLVRPWARLAWLLATIGLGLGGLWAYYVLNFGGFWAWDPVETANLVAWFPLTILLHALLYHAEGRYRTVAPLFAALALPSALFATVATRTGLWVSVHAFTDPSRDFARDPLVRLLNILETGALLRYLTALFFATLLIALAAALWGRWRSRKGRALVAGGCAAAVAVLFLDPVATLGAVFQLGHVVTFGRSAPLGLGILVFLVAAALLLTAAEDPNAANAGRGGRRWLEERSLFGAGIGLLGAAYLVVVLLQLLSVNGYDRRVFDVRAPIVALPIFLVLPAVFLRTSRGARLAVALPAAALTLGVLGAVAARDHWEVLLVLPALLLTAAAAADRGLRFARGARPASGRDRWGALALALGGLLAVVYWSNPPTQVDLWGARLLPPWGFGFLGVALGSFGVLAGLVHASRPQTTAARAAALGLVVAWGAGLSALLGLVALTLVRGGGTPSMGFLRTVRDRRVALRKASVYVLHLGLALGLLGYSFATYESRSSDLLTTGPDAARFGEYEFRLDGATFAALDPEQRIPLEVRVHVLVLKDGAEVRRADLVYWLVQDGTPGHYDARVTVLRLPTEDVYLFPVAVATPDAELTDHVNGARPGRVGADRVDLTAKVLPGMNLVWSGLWMLGLGMTAVLGFGGFAVGTAVPAAAAPRPGATARADDDGT